ncbi:MAG: hypothetical protein LQ340_006249 [Diploschistes diacapsis]|nr:MAG: hypothetical protein LQ340_006249 [Diploschistes diacapsis]
MVFKPFSHLARRSTKAFAHGYAQSLAAASQSSFASTQTPLGHFNHHRFGKTVSLQQKESYHQNALHSNANSKASSSSPHEPNQDGGLDAYLAAWQKHHGSEEWQQFVANKRPSWRHKAGLPTRLFEKDDNAARPTSVPRHAPAIERAHSTSALDDLRKVQDVVEAVALEDVNETIHNENVGYQDVSPASVDECTRLDVLVTGGISSNLSTPAKEHDLPLSTSSESAEWQALVEQISLHEQSSRYADIPAVFEAMLRSGLTPPTRTYNSLLVAAIRLSTSNAQIVPKALDIYSNMRSRDVMPDDYTYTLLIELLSLRALEVTELKASLSRNLIRFKQSDGESSFMLRSRQTELDIAQEDDSFGIATKLFNSAAKQLPQLTLPAATYLFLVEACAKHGDIDQMIRVYTHMESRTVTPLGALFPPMIKAFAASGDLGSAVECYNGYKSLATADNNGVFSLRSRADLEVYGALVRSYVICGRNDGAERFMSKVLKSFEGLGVPAMTQQTRDSIVLAGFVEECVLTGQFEQALAFCTSGILSAVSQVHALNTISSAAADHDNENVARTAYSRIADGEITLLSAISMLAMYLRKNDISSARRVWPQLSSTINAGANLIEPTVAYTVALIDDGCVNDAFTQARLSFDRIRQSSGSMENTQAISDLIDEGIEYLARSLAKRGIVPSPEASMNFIWTMVENGGLLTPVVEQMLAGLGADDVSKLNWADLKLALQVEAGIITENQGECEVAHLARFAHLLERAINSQMPIDKRTTHLIESSCGKLGLERPDVVTSWEVYSRAAHCTETYALPPPTDKSSSTAQPSRIREGLDPYANTLDQRGSAVLIDELEKHGSNSAYCLQEALSRLRNMRRAGRHPRYIAYAKMIAAAAREGRASLVGDLLSLAQRDMPLLLEFSVVRHGWTTILDAMVGASLLLGDRSMAAKYHQELLDIGSAPSANTFGLYITSLKESTKTFDEATEAVKIFLRAKAEGVEPSSFLYNALIGKLGKARRIDDCLFYFAEMRSRNVRPTSVTYGTIVNALCRVSDERFAEELFDEMESMPNYKPRPAPYNSMMQFFLTTKRNSSKVLEYYGRMQSRNIKPTMHTYKLLIDTYATLEPINLAAAEGVFGAIRASGQTPEDVHYASLIHAKGCVLHDMAGARLIFDDVVLKARTRPHPCLYQALLESMVANHFVKDTEALTQDMHLRGVEMTAYIANTLIHGWALEKNIQKASSIYDSVGKGKREPSTYEVMTRAFLAVQDRKGASAVIQEMLSRGYPSAVTSKILELVGPHSSQHV